MKWRRITSLALASALAAAQPAHAQTTNELLIQGYIRFMAYHEAGHMLMNQVEGINAKTASAEDIEESADDFATILLMPDADDAEGTSEMLGAAQAWLKAGPRFSANDPHAPPTARAEQIICHIYGSNPVAFSEFAEIIRPEWNCEATYNAMWDEIERTYVNKTGSPGVPMDISYQAPAPGMERAAEFLKDSGILEDLAHDVAQDFKLIRPTKLMAVNCKALGGEIGTFHYDSFMTGPPEKHFDRIAICYELIDMWLNVDFGVDE